jgi:hypothetical protein
LAPFMGVQIASTRERNTITALHPSLPYSSIGSTLSFSKAAAPRATQDANDCEFISIAEEIDRIIPGETHTQTGRETFARRRGERKMAQRPAIILDLADKTRRQRLRCFNRDVEPDFG